MELRCSWVDKKGERRLHGESEEGGFGMKHAEWMEVKEK